MVCAVPKMPPIRYARSGDVNIAYQVTGDDNPIDLVLAPGTTSHLAAPWQYGNTAMIQRLSSFARLIRFDKRGTGMSDRVTDAATLEERADDIRAVMDATGSKQAVVLGASEGGSMACVFAAMHPDRTRALIVWGCQARMIRAAGYPWGVTPEEYEVRLAALERDWPSREYVRTWGAGLGPEAPEELVDETLERFAMSASPAASVALERMNGALDIRDILPSIRVPALVMARENDPMLDRDAVRDLAGRIPGARLQLFPGKTHYMAAPWAGLDGEPIFATIEEFVTGSPPAVASERFLTTVLFLDIVGSTERATAIGDRAWRELLDAHYLVVSSELGRSGGREVDTAGDGLLATFDGPARAVRFAFAVAKRDRELGLDIRAGVHCGEVERSSGAVRGIAVHIASRVAALARPGEVLTSSTVRDLTAGSGLRFEDRGMRALKGIPEPRQLLCALD